MALYINDVKKIISSITDSIEIEWFDKVNSTIIYLVKIPSN